MANSKLLQQMLESLVNDDQAKAEELFHEYVVSASRDIYESMIDSEIAEEEEKDEDEEVEEASEEDKDEDDTVEENFEAFGDEGEEGPEMGGDATDDLEGDLEMGDEEAEKGEEELFQDLEAIVDELQAKFDELKGIEGEEHGDDFGDEEGGEEGGNPFAKEEDFDQLATVREYVEKVPGGHGAEKKGAGEGALVGTGNKGQGSATNAQSLKFNKNDMGGTTANILRADTEQGVEANQGQLKGSSLIKQKPTVDNAGNINVPGGKAGNSFTKKEPGHGAEKAGAKETADKGAGSLFRGRR